MSISKLQGLSAQPPYDYETVEKVKGLLNSGDVDVNDVSNYFNVEKTFVLESLTGIPRNAFTSGTLDAPQVAAVQKLIEKGVASTKDVSQYFSAPEEVVERNLTEQLGYSPSQIAEARAGTPITPKSVTEEPKTVEDLSTGLLGAEQALKGGAQAAIDRLDQLNAAGRQDLQSQYALGLEQAQQQAERARGDITSSTTQGLEALGAGIGQARTDITDAFGRAEGMFDPYREAGTTALQQQLALSGALGQDAFNQAYQESPQMAFLREQGMRANLAGAAATGGLGGGNVQKELQRFGQGLASQGLQQQIANLGALSGQGLGASGSAATIATQGGSNLANLASAEAQARLQARTQEGANLANIASALGGQQLQTQTNLGNQLSAYGLSTGLPAAQALNNLGVNLAAGRMETGRDLANRESSLATNLANIYGSQGVNLANLFGGQRDFLSGIYGDAALNEARAQQGYGANIADIQGNIGSGISGVPNAPIFTPDYQNQAMNALYAAGAGYNFGRTNFPQGGQQNTGTYRGDLSGGWGGFAGNQGNFYPNIGANYQPIAMNYDPQLYANQNLQGIS